VGILSLRSALIAHNSHQNGLYIYVVTDKNDSVCIIESDNKKNKCNDAMTSIFQFVNICI
jgi:hypothetical protein